MEILSSIDQLAQRQFKTIIQKKWIKEQLYLDKNQFFNHLIEDINSAKESVRFETYIFEKCRLGNTILECLLAASHRGVQVQLMVDGLGSPQFWTQYGKTIQNSSIRVHIYRAQLWQGQLKSQNIWGQILESLIRLRHLNNGNHRKTCLIDDENAWITSANIMESDWTEVGVFISGQEIIRLKRAFDNAFSGNLLQIPFQTRKNNIILNSSFILRRQSHWILMKRLKEAKKRIWIQTPYFNPTPRLFRRLIKRAQSGIEIILIVPEVIDIPLLKGLSYYFYRKMIQAGIQIYEHPKPFIHKKELFIDDEIYVGSSNMNHRSLFHDLEVDVKITHHNNQTQLIEQFQLEQARSLKLSTEKIDNISLWKRLFIRTFFLLRYWA